MHFRIPRCFFSPGVTDMASVQEIVMYDERVSRESDVSFLIDSWLLSGRFVVIVLQR
jgi:hypothetical protein